MQVFGDQHSERISRFKIRGGGGGDTVKDEINMSENEYYLGLLNELRKLPKETEWVEFKHNNADPQEMGEYISALANSAALSGKNSGYLIW